MCTVSFINTPEKTIITANRDESPRRGTAIAPKTYTYGTKKIIFPKDPKSGGTWYAADEYTNVAVLLNGAAKKHISKGNYRKSRGLILLDILKDASPRKRWDTIYLNNIEPFTLILFENPTLYQLRWDGTKKESVLLRNNENHIWSSATLYPKAVRKKREEWFEEYMDGKTEISGENLLHFHQDTQRQDLENGLVINRKNKVKTLSITQAVIQQNKVELKYIPLENPEIYKNTYFIL